MNRFYRCASCCALLFLAALLGCGDDDADPADGSVDASVDAPGDAAADAPTDAPDRTLFDASFPGAPPPSPDGLGWCCVAATPSCGCAALGGFVSDPGTCPRFGTCDMPPGDWTPAIDEHGCDYYRVPIVPTICECLCVPMVDAGISESDAGSADGG